MMFLVFKPSPPGQSVRSKPFVGVDNGGSDLMGSVTILAPQRLHAPSPILTLQRIEEIDRRAT